MHIESGKHHKSKTGKFLWQFWWRIYDFKLGWFDVSSKLCNKISSLFSLNLWLQWWNKLWWHLRIASVGEHLTETPVHFPWTKVIPYWFCVTIDMNCIWKSLKGERITSKVYESCKRLTSIAQDF